MDLKKHIPTILLYSRLAFFFILVGLIVFEPANSDRLVLILLYLGIFTDIFDGIIARKLNLSNERFRMLDTVFDLLFYLSVLYYIFSTQYLIIMNNQYLIAIILALEASMYFISLARFRKLPSPHAIMSKFWGLYIVIEFTLILLGIKGNHFTLALYAGIAAHTDRVLIYILLPHWDLDIPSSYHALLIRQGKPIKKNKLFNG